MLSRGRIFMKRRAGPIVLPLQHCSVCSLSLIISQLLQDVPFYPCSWELLPSTVTGCLTCLHQQGVLTCYRLDGLGFEFRSALAIFFSPKPSRAVLGPTQPSVQWVLGSFPGGKRLEREVNHSPVSSAENMNAPLVCLSCMDKDKPPLYNSCVFDQYNHEIFLPFQTYQTCCRTETDISVSANMTTAHIFHHVIKKSHVTLTSIC
jgi:hypothetical protein